MIGNTTALNDYNKWFNTVIENLPGVFHYSWYDLERKMRLYRDYWTRHWESLSGKTYEDTAQSNMMFDVPWSQVTDDMIKTRAAEFKSKLGGWIWHRKWDGTTTTPHLTINRSQPKIMLNRMKRNEGNRSHRRYKQQVTTSYKIHKQNSPTSRRKTHDSIFN